jgi:hypothetical protein
MFRIFEVIQSPNAAIVVVEVDERFLPCGLALELHMAILGRETLAFWLLEDGRLARRVRIGKS